MLDSLDLAPEAKNLCSGIFWIITESSYPDDFELLTFKLPCDPCGNVIGTPDVQPNSKSGNSFNHKKLWESDVRNNPAHRPYNRNPYDHYPRGRVEISNNRAAIYLNPHINRPDIIDEIKLKFGLSQHNIPEIRVIADGSVHYKCFIDRDD